MSDVKVEIEDLVNACQIITTAYKTEPWFQNAFHDSIITALDELNETRHSPMHYHAARKIAERIFDIE